MYYNYKILLKIIILFCFNINLINYLYSTFIEIKELKYEENKNIQNYKYFHTFDKEVIFSNKSNITYISIYQQHYFLLPIIISRNTNKINFNRAPPL